MRVFLVACLVALVLALSAAAVLDRLVQKPAENAFSTPAVRI
jgi:hypothetical protein